MEWLEILKRIEGGEGEQTEFKSTIGNFEPHRKTLAGFANTTGGVLILGVSDHGEIVGIDDPPDGVQERLSGFLESGLSQPLRGALGFSSSPDGFVHWVVVPRQRGFEPVRFKGRVYIRRGRATVEPSGPELQSLYNTFGYILTEEQTVAGTGVADISVDAFDGFLAQVGLSRDTEPLLPLKTDLTNRGVLVELDGQPLATLYGLLAFGKKPQDFPQTRSFLVRCSAYDGTDRAAPVLTSHDAAGRLDQQVDGAIQWLKALGTRETYDEDGQRLDLLRAPLDAFREAIVNAVAHRDYAIIGAAVHVDVFEDRTEVTSPGSLPNHMTPASVLAGGLPRSRNEAMANFMMSARFMEQRGRGWPVIKRAVADVGGRAELVVDPDGQWVRVVIWNDPR